MYNVLVIHIRLKDIVSDSACNLIFNKKKIKPFSDMLIFRN